MAVTAPAPAQAAPPAAAAQTPSANAKSAQALSNLTFLRQSYPKQAVCPPAGGSGNNQAYAAGQQLVYDVPTAEGGVLESLLFECALVVNPATGSTAVYAANKSAPFGLIDSVNILYNGTQHRFRPIFLRDGITPLLKYLANANAGEKVPSIGVANATLTGVVSGTTAVTVNTANPWNFWFRFPMRMLPRSAAGMLPIQGNSTRCQIQVNCAGNALGQDPILNVVAPTTGTGHALTNPVSGTIAVIAEYRDGTRMNARQPGVVDLRGLPTVQWDIDRQLNPLTAASTLRQRIDRKLKHLYVVSFVVDANQSTDYALDSNISGIELDMDAVGTNKFYGYGTSGVNIGMNEWRERFRYDLGQDMPEGVIPWVRGPGFLGIVPDNLEGMSYLDMTPGAWPDVNWGIQVATVSGQSTIDTFVAATPRVETYLVSVNDAGLLPT